MAMLKDTVVNGDLNTTGQVKISNTNLVEWIVQQGTFTASGRTCYYRYYNSGRKEYWGSLPVASASSGATVTVTFPTPFTSATSYAIVENPVTNRGAGGHDREINPYTKSTTNFTIYWNTRINISYYDFYCTGK